jgi:hypothetical protein
MYNFMHLAKTTLKGQYLISILEFSAQPQAFANEFKRLFRHCSVLHFLIDRSNFQRCHCTIKDQNL